jgi:hypothetical protein
MASRTLTLSFIGLCLAMVHASAKPYSGSMNTKTKSGTGASPSGNSIGNTARTTGTANYPADPNSASPSAQGNKSVSGQAKGEGNGNGQEPNVNSTSLEPSTSQ